MVYTNNFGQTRLGIRFVSQVVNAVDADATAFIAAAGITNLTQAAAISTLVNDLKTYGLWTKMKALYPFVGGTAAQHRFNLKDPRTINAAFYLDFNGGWTHTSTGALPNGLNTFADTKLTPSSTFNTTTFNHLSYYSRTSAGSQGYSYDMGSYDHSVGGANALLIRRSNNVSMFGTNYPSNILYSSVIPTVTDGSGLFIGTQNGSSIKYFRNTLLLAMNTNTSTNEPQPVYSPIFIGTLGEYGYATTNRWSNKECAFASIGTSLTDTDATNFYNSVQKFQTTLGRQIGSPIVSDTDAQAFINVAGLTDLGQANAVNTLVVDLKAAGVWTKMKALYPFVGGTATTHKWNLKDPRDLDAAFRIVFNGGMTHTSLGMVSNYTTSYADTRLTPSTALSSLFSQHVSVYSQTSDASPVNTTNSIGEWQDSTKAMLMKIRSLSNVFSWEVGNGGGASTSNTDGKGFYLGSVVANNSVKLYKNNTNVATNTTTFSGSLPTQMQPIGKNENKTFSFASIGDGLTDVEAAVFYNSVQKFQTTLGRQIGTPVLAEGQTAGLLDTYSSATVAYSLRKLRTGYYGFAIRVRRSSDNAEQDIAFKTDGTLDTTSLLAFVGSGNGFVTTWYDQSGNGYNAYQSTAINQPLIVSSGSLTTNGGKPAIRCAGSTGLLINQISLGTTHSMFAVIDWSGPYKEYFGSFGNSWAFYQVDGEYKANGVIARTNAAFTTNRFLGTLLRVNTQLQYYQNSATLGSAFTISSNNVFNLSNLIGEDYNWGFAGDQQEAIIYTSSMESNRAGIESNINSYYSIY